jgi:hypothetical protein
MPELRLSKRADPAFVEAFKSLVGRLARSAGANSRDPVLMYLAGGAAMHFYTGSRISDDVDAVFSKRLLMPADSAVIYRDAEGNARSVHFDPTYNETFALIHEDAHQDALQLAFENLQGIRIMVLRPVDLAVSKLARFGDIDRNDILDLARAGLVTAKQLRKRAEAALPGYVGDTMPVRNSIDIACRGIEALKRRAMR